MDAKVQAFKNLTCQVHTKLVDLFFEENYRDIELKTGFKVELQLKNRIYKNNQVGINLVVLVQIFIRWYRLHPSCEVDFV